MNPPLSEALVRPLDSYDDGEQPGRVVVATYGPFPSKHGGPEHHVIRYSDGSMDCTDCKGRQYHGTCEHIEGILYALGDRRLIQKREAVKTAETVGRVRRAYERAQARQTGLMGAGHKMSAASMLAWFDERLQDGFESSRARALEYIIRNGPCCRAQVERACHLTVNRAAAAINKLKGGLVRVSHIGTSPVTGVPVEFYVAEARVVDLYRAARGPTP